MFDVYCPDHGSRVLLFSQDIETILNTQKGMEVHYRCFCGHRGVWLTGRILHEASGNDAIRKRQFSEVY